jgi:hypothetical protein
VRFLNIPAPCAAVLFVGFFFYRYQKRYNTGYFTSKVLCPAGLKDSDKKERKNTPIEDVFH